jgi:hypothetical protein
MSRTRNIRGMETKKETLEIDPAKLKEERAKLAGKSLQVVLLNSLNHLSDELNVSNLASGSSEDVDDDNYIPDFSQKKPQGPVSS